MDLRVAALPRVIEVDAVFALPAPTRHGRERNGSLTAGLEERLPRVIFKEVGIGPDLVGDTGIEPVTSSV
jgi:hypothetical protein